MLATIVIAAIGGGLTVFLDDVQGAPGVIGTALIATLVMGAALFPCLWWWRHADEAVREAHKWAWFWGGTTGTAVGGIVLITVLGRSLQGAPAFLDGMTPADILYTGAMGVMLFQVIGYAIAWAAWWLQRR